MGSVHSPSIGDSVPSLGKLLRLLPRLTRLPRWWAAAGWGNWARFSPPPPPPPWGKGTSWPRRRARRSDMCGWREGGKAPEGGKGKGPGLLVRKGGGKGKGGRETLVNLASRAADAAMLSVVMASGLGRSGWGLRGSCSIIFSVSKSFLVASSDSLLA